MGMPSVLSGWYFGNKTIPGSLSQCQLLWHFESGIFRYTQVVLDRKCLNVTEFCNQFSSRSETLECKAITDEGTFMIKSTDSTTVSVQMKFLKSKPRDRVAIIEVSCFPFDLESELPAEYLSKWVQVVISR